MKTEGAESARVEAPGRRADEAVARKFSRLMKASTSPYGVLTDPVIVTAVTAPLLVTTLAVRGAGIAGAALWALEAATLAPVVVALVAGAILTPARKAVVSWLASLPFPVENVNGLLNGVGEELEVRFEGEFPDSQALNAELDAIDPQSFVSKVDEEASILEVRLGVVQSKLNPARSNYLRYRRCREITDTVLVKLSERYPIAEIRVK